MVVVVFFLLEPPLPLVLGLVSASAVVAFFLLEPPLPLVLGFASSTGVSFLASDELTLAARSMTLL